MYKKFCFSVLMCAFSLLIASCGGGGSSSGGQDQNNNVSFCVATSDETDPLGLIKRTYTNNCGFAVNLGIGVTSLGRVETLDINESVTILLPGHGFVACRAPSMPFDADESTLRDFRCT